MHIKNQINTPYKSLLIIILIFVSLNKTFSQTPVYAEVKPFSGFIVPHRLGMESLAQKPVLGSEINIFYQTTSDNAFNRFYNFPAIGFGFHYDYLGNPNVLGEAFALQSFMEFPLKSIKNNLDFNSRVAMGLAYVTKTFDKDFNDENVAVSTNTNFYFNWTFNLSFTPDNSPFILSFGTGLVHYSNGAVIKPNKGLNQIIFSGGVAYNIFNHNPKRERKVLETESYRKNEFWIMGTLSTADEYAYGDVGRGGGFLCSTIAGGWLRRYSPVSKYGIAFDVFYNENFYYYYDRNWDTLVERYDNPQEILRCGISLGHELMYNNLSLITNLGIYYYKKVKPQEWLYTRIGLKYYLIDNVFINLSLKAYGFKAHYIESGIGFSLYKD